MEEYTFWLIYFSGVFINLVVNLIILKNNKEFNIYEFYFMILISFLSWSLPIFVVLTLLYEKIDNLLNAIPKRLKNFYLFWTNKDKLKS